MIYLVDGDTYTGKTTFLRKYIKANPSKLSKYMTDEQWKELLIKVLTGTFSEEECIKQFVDGFEDFDIVCIDNIDLWRGCEMFQKISAKIMVKLNDKIQFFLSGIDLESNISPMLSVFRINGIAVSYIDYNRNI